MAPTVTSESILKGRVAATTKANVSLNIPLGSWSVVVSDGVQEVINPAPVPGPAGRTSRGRSKMADLIFYASKSDAWEESAYLNGKRACTPDEVTARRSRSIAGVMKDITINVMGGMGIGLVEGENNVAGTGITSPAPAPTGAPAGASSRGRPRTCAIP